MSIQKYYDSENDNTYLNINVNPINSSLYPYSDAIFDNTFTKPIIDDCSKYYCAVTRFEIPLQSIPLFIMPIVPNQANPNLTPFQIGVKYISAGPTTNYYTQNIIYQTGNIAIQAPVQNQINQVITSYYYCWSYNNLLDIVNQALVKAVNAFVAAFPASPQAASVATGDYPYFSLDPKTSLISLIVHKSWQNNNPSLPVVSGNNNYVTPNPAVGTATIYINFPLVRYLDAFPYTTAPVLNNGDSVEFIIPNLPTNQFYGPNDPITTTTGAPANTVLQSASNHIYVEQEYFFLENWTSLKKIILSSSTIPVNNEFIPNVNVQNGQTVSFPIISDFAPQISKAGDERSTAYYITTGPYRLMDMSTKAPLQTINLKIYWQDAQANLYPLQLYNGTQATIKIGFFNRKLYKPENILKLGV